MFFGWGATLAISSVLLAPVLTRRFGLRPVLFAMLGLLGATLVAMGVGVRSVTALVALVITAGLFLGVLNTALTETVMVATSLPHGVASATYSGVRFLGGAIAPAVSGGIAASLGAAGPYWFGAAALVVSMLVLALGGHTLAHVGRPHVTARAEAEAITVGDEV